MTADRRIRSDERPNRAILLAWLGVSALLTLVAWPKISQGRMPDPDDFLRLVQVRDLLGGQAWYDLHQYRITPPDGILMHWSRLVDVPLYLSIRALTPLFGQSIAEQVTAFTIPLLVFGLVCLVIGRLAWRLFDVETAVLSCLVLGMSPLVVQQIQPMRIDHHAYQILSIAIAAWAISWRSALRGGALAGLAMGLGAMISLETLPMAAGFGLVLLLRWLRDHQQRWWLVCYLKGLALTLALTFAATRGLPDLAQHCDVISPAHIGFFVIVALGSAAIATIPRVPRMATLGLLSGAGLAAAAFFAMAAPQCLGSPFGDFDPVVRQHWYMNVREGLPIWHQDFYAAVPPLLQGVIALGSAIAIFTRQRDWLRSWWFEYSLLLLVALIGGALTFRSFSFAGVLSAVPTGWLAQRLLQRFRGSEGIAAKVASAIVLYLMLVPSTPFAVMKSIDEQGRNMAGPVGTRNSSCDPFGTLGRLNRLPPSRLFAPFDIGPAMLLSTHHSVAASGHHRGQAAIRDVIDAFTRPPAQSRTIIDRYKTEYVVVCTDLVEPDNFVRMGGPDGLMARLEAGEAPDWLAPVDVGGPPTLRVWKVRPGGIPAPAR